LAVFLMYFIIKYNVFYISHHMTLFEVTITSNVASQCANIAKTNNILRVFRNSWNLDRFVNYRISTFKLLFTVIKLKRMPFR
jgi:hypothetical protein